MRLRIRLCRLSGSSSVCERRVVVRIDALAADVVEQLLDVERIALRARGDQLDERRRGARVGAQHLPRASSGSAAPRAWSVELGERDLVEMRQLLEPEPAADARRSGR